MPEDAKFMITLMGAMHNGTTQALEGVLHNQTIQGREHEARFHLLQDAILDAMSSEFILSPAVVVNRRFEAIRHENVLEWLEEHYGPNWRDYATPKRRYL